MCPGPGGNILIAWLDGRNGDADIYLQAVTPSITTLWPGDGVPVCTAARNQLQVGMVPISDGVILVWADARSGGYDTYAQRINASGTALWAPNGVVVCNATGDQTFTGEMRSTFVASDGSGGAIAVWSDKRSGTGSDLYAQRLNGSGVAQWAANGVPVCTAADEQSNAVLSPDGAGGVVIAWEDYRSGYSDIYAQHLNPSGSPPWSSYEPRLASDGAGSAIITWHDFGPPNYEGDIRAQRLNAAVGTPLWTASGVPVCMAVGMQYGARITADGSGGAIIGWVDDRSGIGSDRADIYAQRLDASGNMLWTADGVAVCGATDSQVDPALASDGSGGAVLAWTDRRDGANDLIFAQHMTGAGTGLWWPGGVSGVPGLKFRSGDLELAPPRPNPTTGSFSIGFTLGSAGDARIELLDVAGRRVLRRQLDALGPGWHSIALTPDHPLPAGVYLVRLVQRGQSAIRKICLLP
jgi:hypothetical protein